jgi:energy-coupling factor transporter ATP-binding protein EcfA2
LSSLIQALAGVCHTLQVFDEPTAWLSPEGIDDLLKCLHERAHQHDLCIWLLDHRSMTYPFDGSYIAVKEHAGTSVQQLA